ncbi:PaeR7I family type II restriction endonuclease [Corynebacterium sp. MSK105]|uniref:PaeR7I family type II restriction endonuclease n=1 Tax=unclassified Corynebacterium TaxID=2624378 RepID=UPI0025508F5E|nr:MULTISPECIES: PaeR7I family type II restriction endonuclease [unclassified Corynebacterium]MDK8483682.1 PaeR7I family type II restriction endonuclease [Corynebacterium sp. MSK074]MDK8691117.1 PaeR7I family type II restriction endonuclease [Corynebacterium sp. MSK105]
MDRAKWELAVAAYWQGLDLQRNRQGKITGIKDYGNRSAVTGGKQMDGLQQVVADIWLSDPDIELTVKTTGKNNLPAYFRPTKNWDLIVLHRGALVAAMEFKSQKGPSFGNNFNNRTEEALGLAADSQMAAERGLFGRLKPWLGFVMLVESADGSTRPVGLPGRMPFEPDPIFYDTSYIDRYRIFFERMVAESNYDAAALITSPVGQGEFFEPSMRLSVANLEAAIIARIAYIKALPDDVFDALTK